MFAYNRIVPKMSDPLTVGFYWDETCEYPLHTLYYNSNNTKANDNGYDDYVLSVWED
jgi:hypothetical protein